MSIGQTIRNLWRDAPVWRYTTVAAGVLTAVVIAGNVTGGSGSSSPTSPPLGGNQTPPSKAGPPPQPPVAQTPAPVEARWQQFLNKVNAAEREQRTGERCSRMADSLTLLERDDWAWAKGDQDRQDALKTAQDCSDNIVDSDARLAAVTTSFADVQDDGATPQVARLAASWDRLTSFDRSRELPAATRDAISAGERARDRLEASDDRIETLVSAAAPPRGDGARHVKALAAAGQAITAFDRSRLNDNQRRALEAASDAARELAASQDRLSRLFSALAGAQTGTDAARRELIDAVASITPFDAVQAEDGQREQIARARATAAEFAMAQLTQVSANFEPDREDPQLYARLRNLKRLIEANGGLSEPSPDQTAALGNAEIAAARIDESDRRLARLRDVATTWQRNPSPEQADMVAAAYAAVDNPFDRARFEAVHEDAYTTLDIALTVLNARKQDGLTASNRNRVPIYVADATGSEHGEEAVELLKGRLSAANYRLVDRADAAAARLAVSRIGISPSRIQVGSRKYDGAAVGADLMATWSFTDEVFMRASGRGRNAGRSVESATRGAVADAVTAAFSDFHAQVMATRASP